MDSLSPEKMDEERAPGYFKYGSSKGGVAMLRNIPARSAVIQGLKPIWVIPETSRHWGFVREGLSTVGNFIE